MPYRCGSPPTNGTEGDRCKIVTQFMEEVKKSYPDVGVTFWDERLSTVAANRSLLEADLSRRKRKKVIDKMAADAKSGKGKGISSASNDGYSESYVVQTEEQLRSELQSSIRAWLSGTGLVGAC